MLAEGAGTLTVVSAPSAAQKVRTEMLVSTDWLARHHDYAIVLDVGDARSFAMGHIPGARHLDFDRIVTTRNRVPNELPDVEALERIFTNLGVGAACNGLRL